MCGCCVCGCCMCVCEAVVCVCCCLHPHRGSGFAVHAVWPSGDALGDPALGSPAALQAEELVKEKAQHRQGSCCHRQRDFYPWRSLANHYLTCLACVVDLILVKIPLMDWRVCSVVGALAAFLGDLGFRSLHPWQLTAMHLQPLNPMPPPHCCGPQGCMWCTDRHAD